MKLNDLLNSDGTINHGVCVKFNKDILLRRNDNGVFYCNKPSYQLSKLINLNVHSEYKLPYNWNSDDLEYITFVVRGDEKIMDELFEIILDLNPGIDKLYSNSSTSNRGSHSMGYKYDILLGMGSLFNLDDISEYINGGVGYIKKQDSEYTKKLNQIEHKIKNYVQYVPSYKTLDIVYTHLFK